MNEKYIVALDQGTSSSRAMLINSQGVIIGIEQEPIRQYFPHPGWVEHDPAEIIRTQLDCFSKVLQTSNCKPSDVIAIGITNQRETIVVWDKTTGKPVHNAIVWQDKRTSNYCKSLVDQGWEETIKRKTGLVIDSYFSGPKLKWILDNVQAAKTLSANGRLAFGTIDTWLIWNLTKGKCYATDYSNASRTMMFDIHQQVWDVELLKEFSVTQEMLPDVRESIDNYHYYEIDGSKIPILAVAGDQQAALFGQACFKEGMAKNTYGTGCFLLMNTGPKAHHSNHGLVTTIAWRLNGRTTYALEGSIFNAGASVQWLRDGLHLIDQSKDSEYFASKALGTNGVYVVPAFNGLGAPFWDMNARGAIFGLTRDTGKDHIIKATLESIAYQVRDIVDAMEHDGGMRIKSLKVDGGASVNNMLMQFQSNILDIEIERPHSTESTALGVAYMAGIASGLWDQESIAQLRGIDRVFRASMDKQERENLFSGWRRAVSRSREWLST